MAIVDIDNQSAAGWKELDTTAINSIELTGNNSIDMFNGIKSMLTLFVLTMHSLANNDDKYVKIVNLLMSRFRSVIEDISQKTNDCSKTLTILSDYLSEKFSTVKAAISNSVTSTNGYEGFSHILTIFNGGLKTLTASTQLAPAPSLTQTVDTSNIEMLTETSTNVKLDESEEIDTTVQNESFGEIEKLQNLINELILVATSLINTVNTQLNTIQVHCAREDVLSILNNEDKFHTKKLQKLLEQINSEFESLLTPFEAKTSAHLTNTTMKEVIVLNAKLAKVVLKLNEERDAQINKSFNKFHERFIDLHELHNESIFKKLLTKLKDHFIKNNKRIFLDKLMSFLPEPIRGPLNSFRIIFRGLRILLKNTFKAIKATFRVAIKGMTKGLRAIFRSIINIAKTIAKPFITAFKTGIRLAIRGFKMLIRGLIGAAKILFKLVRWIATRLYRFMKWFGRKLGQKISSMMRTFGKIFSKLLDHMGKFGEKIKGFFKNMKGIFRKLSDKLKDVFKNVIKKLKNIAKKLKDVIKKALSKVFKAIGNVIRKIVGKAMTMIKSLVKKIVTPIVKWVVKRIAKKAAKSVGKSVVKQFMKKVAKMVFKALAKFIAGCLGLNILPGPGTALSIVLIIARILIWLATDGWELWKAYKELDKCAKDFNMSIPELLKMAVVDEVVAWFKELWEKLKNLGKLIWKKILEWAANAAKAAKKFICGMLGAAKWFTSGKTRALLRFKQDRRKDIIRSVLAEKFNQINKMTEAQRDHHNKWWIDNKKSLVWEKLGKVSYWLNKMNEEEDSWWPDDDIIWNCLKHVVGDVKEVYLLLARMGIFMEMKGDIYLLKRMQDLAGKINEKREELRKKDLVPIRVTSKIPFDEKEFAEYSKFLRQYEDNVIDDMNEMRLKLNEAHKNIIDALNTEEYLTLLSGYTHTYTPLEIDKKRKKPE